MYGRGFGDPIANVSYVSGNGIRLYVASQIGGTWSPNVTIVNNTYLTAVLPVPSEVGVALDVSFGTATASTWFPQSLSYANLPTIVSLPYTHAVVSQV